MQSHVIEKMEGVIFFLIFKILLKKKIIEGRGVVLLFASICVGVNEVACLRLNISGNNAARALNFFMPIDINIVFWNLLNWRIWMGETCF